MLGPTYQENGDGSGVRRAWVSSPRKMGNLGWGDGVFLKHSANMEIRGQRNMNTTVFEPNGMTVIFAFSSTLTLQDHKTNSFNFTALHLQHSYYEVKNVVSYCGRMCVGDLQFLKTVGHLA